ncbi:MAG: hypothetical protein HY898_18635 [Deltaproteobacteria bacterium]|nr:hypothetical protein [Deltaproteobacteria bacterium]
MSARFLPGAALIAGAFSIISLGCGGQPPAPQPASAERPEEVRARECTSLVTVINISAEQINGLGDAGTAFTDSQLAAIASALETAAARTQTLTLTDRALQQRAAEYKEMAGRYAANVRVIIAARQANDLPRWEAATVAAQAAGESEDRIIASINAFCSAP